MSLDMMHNEVALSLTVDAAIGERLRLLFTGYGALEGALLSLLLFSLLALAFPAFPRRATRPRPLSSTV